MRARGGRGGRGRGRGGRGGNRKQNNRQQKRKFDKPKRVRKTYSLYGNNKQDTSKNQTKRKHEFNNENKVDETKKPKIESKPPVEKIETSESEEEVDQLTQLRSTFKNTNKTIEAIESSDESADSDEEEDLQETDVLEENIEETDKSSDEEDNGSDNESVDSDKTNENNEIPDIGDNLNKDYIDPFEQHLLYDLNLSLLSSVQSIPMNVSNFIEEWPHLGKLIIQIPNCTEEKLEKQQFSVMEEKIFAPSGKVPKRIHLNKDPLESFCIKTQIVGNLSNANTSLVNKEKPIPLTSLQGEIFSIINNYQDLYYPHRNFDNSEEIRYVYCLHALNHILKTRMKVIHHNVRLSTKEDIPEEFRDQGLTRPKVLIIAPFRDSAYRIIQFLINILITEDKGNVINKNRFLEDFTGNTLVLPKKNPKPEDYELTFAGNSNDDFKIGITVTKKSLKLYADFYSADIIIASPLGLRYTIGAEGEPERNYDFLASIELLIFDQTELYLMQNWDHVLHIMNHIHLQPKESHGTDFTRVRTWSLNGWAKYYRQTLIFSSVMLPEITSIFNKRCFNYAGKVKVVKEINNGSIRQVYVQVPHVFQKICADSVENSIDARFNFFVNSVLPQQKEDLMKQTMIYISSYFDYVKLRNYFKKEDVSFVQICEYSKDSKVARARDLFFHGDKHFLLYTERHHFFNRIRIKGVRHLVFYQPPNFPNFYYEICNLMQESNMNKKIGSISNMTVTILYTKYDIQQLAAIVGTERAGKMLQSEKNVHLLVTDAD